MSVYNKFLYNDHPFTITRADSEKYTPVFEQQVVREWEQKTRINKLVTSFFCCFAHFFGKRIVSKDELQKRLQQFRIAVYADTLTINPNTFEKDTDTFITNLEKLNDFKKQQEFLFRTADMLSKSLLKNAIPKLKETSELRIFLENILTRVEQLQKIEKRQHALEFQDIVKIIVVAERKFKELQTSQQQTPVYASKKETGLSRSFIIDFENKSIIVLSKKHGDIQASGKSKKVTAAVSIPMHLNLDNVKEQSEARSWARLVNKPGQVINPKEILLARRFSNDVHLVIQYPSIKHPGTTKTTIIENRYEKDISVHVVSTKKQRVKLNEQQVAKICYGIGMSLFKMHHEGFVHKDISSSNVMISHGQAKLKDFGLAHATDSQNKEFPMHKCMSNSYGLPIYSAPEVLAKTKLDDEAKQAKAEDMYAVGCLLYELISDHQLPWEQNVDPGDEAAALRTRIRIQKIWWPQKLLLESQSETNKARKALLEICASLVDPNPATRMTVDKFMNKLCQG